MSKSRIPALTRGLAGPSSRQPKTLASKQLTNTPKSSNLLHYGFAAVKLNSSKTGKKNAESEAEDQENKEKSRTANDDALDDSRKVDSSTKSMPDAVQDKECGSTTKDSDAPNEKQMNLSEVQLGALSYSLSELADKISPSKNGSFDDEGWETKQKPGTVGTDHRNSLGRGKVSSDVVSGPHSKSPYARKNETEDRPYLSKQKSFNKIKPLSSQELNLSDGDKARSNEVQADRKESTEKEEIMFKAASPSHQESIESGCNSSWSASSLSEDKNYKHGTKCNADTDVDMDIKDLNDVALKGGPSADEKLKNEVSGAESYEIALQKKISDVEKRINSLILGRNSIDLGTSETEDNSNEITRDSQESIDKNTSKSSSEILKDEKDETLTNGLENDSHIEQNTPIQNNTIERSKSKWLDSSKLENDQELSSKSLFPIQQIRKTSLDESRVNQKSKRPGLVRRRTTLVTFRLPRQSSAFNEVDDSGVLEIDETGFVQCLTDVRAMKTMLLKLKRELQEAEVVSPLAKSKSLSSRSITNISEPNDSLDDTGLRRYTYDSSEGIQSLRRIRSASLSRRKHSSCMERPAEEQLPAESSTEASVEEIKQKSADEKIENMREEMDALKEKMKELEKERDTLFLDKEEIEHELEAKNHTIMLLQKQLEVHENDEEMAYLQRQVATLTFQVRQQQQKITELKYRSSTPPNAPTSTSPTSGKKDSGKHDIKNKLRDAFVRHLEESSKSHVLLSKHIEKAEFTIGEAQKGLKSLYIASTPQNTASKENLTEVAKSSDKTRFTTNLLRTARMPDEETRRYSWTANSVDKIIKTWKETAKSIENISSAQSTNYNKKSTQLPKPKSLRGSPHLEFL